MNIFGVDLHELLAFKSLRFPQRIRKREIKIELERENLSFELRNSLWTMILESTLASKKDNVRYTEKSKFFRAV